METPETYQEFLQLAAQNRLTDPENYNWKRLFKENKIRQHFKGIELGFYALDFTTRKYLDVNDVMVSLSGYPREKVVNGGLDFALKLWHPDDFRVYNEKILPVNLKFLKNTPKAELMDYQFTCNYRVKKRNGNYMRLEQLSFFNDFSSDGMPLLTFGFLRDITHRTHNDVIVHTIEKVQSDGNQLMFRAFHDPERPDSVLTPRQTEVMNLIVIGFDNRAIADELGISINTVERHRKDILLRTGMKHIIQAAIYAKDMGLINGSTKLLNDK